MEKTRSPKNYTVSGVVQVTLKLTMRRAQPPPPSLELQTCTTRTHICCAGDGTLCLLALQALYPLSPSLSPGHLSPMCLVLPGSFQC